MTTPLGIALNQLATYTDVILENVYPDVGRVERPEFTPAPVYSTVESSIGCSWAPASKTGMEYMRAGQINAVVPYEITMSGSTDVKPQDRVIIEARGNEPEHTFEVKAILRNAGLPMTVLGTLEG
jgi:hypothetical protein